METETFSGETGCVVLERDEKDPRPRGGKRAFLEELQLRLDEMLSEGIRGQKGFDPNDDIGFACGCLEKIRNGEEVDFFAAASLAFESEN